MYGCIFQEQGHWHTVFFGVFVLLTVMWPFSCLPSVFFFCLCLGSSTHPPLCCPGRFRLRSAIQTMSGIMTARKKATGFSRFTMNRSRPTEAASKNRPDYYQQQLICVKLSQAVLVSLGSGSRSLVKGETENPGCLEEGLSRGINVNLSFRSCTWKGHFVISHMVSCGIRFLPEICPYHLTRDITLTLAL